VAALSGNLNPVCPHGRFLILMSDLAGRHIQG
jgi:hypothetical protein